jgi:hypothetical protein
MLCMEPLCVRNAVSLFYLELYVKLSIYLSIMLPRGGSCCFNDGNRNPLLVCLNVCWFGDVVGADGPKSKL